MRIFFNKLILFICTLGFCGSLHAMPEESTFGLDQNSSEWRTIELEEWLVWKISRDLTQFVPLEHFKVYADIGFKTDKDTNRRVSRVNLTMLGTVSTMVSEDRPNPQMGLFGKVKTLDITLVVSDAVSERNVEAMLTMIHKRIPLIEASRIKTSVVRIDRPGLTITAWLKEFKTVIGLAAILALIFYGLFHILRRIRIRGSVQFSPGEIKVETQTAVAETTESHAPVHMLPVEALVNGYDVVKPNEVDDVTLSLLPETEVALVLRRIRSLLLSMKIENCAQMAKADPELGALAVNLLGAESAAKLMYDLKPTEKKAVVSESLCWNREHVVRNAADYMDKIRLYKDQKNHVAAIDKQLSVYLDQVGPDGEEKVFEELLARQDYPRFTQLVRDALPTQLLQWVPEGALKAAFLHISHEDRLEVLAFTPAGLEKKVWDLLPPVAREARSYLERDVKRLYEDMKNSGVSPSRGLTRLMRKVREALRKNPEWSNMVKPHVEDWIYERTKGLEGARSGKKSA